MGVGLVVSPALGFLIGPEIGIFATNVVTITSAAILTAVRWNDIEWRRVAWILASAIPGAACGAILVRELPSAWLQVILGSTILLAILITFTAKNPPRADGPVPLSVAGSIGGMLNTTAGIAAPAMVIYSRMARWRHPGFGASLQPVFLGMGLLSIFFKTLFGSLGSAGELPHMRYLTLVIAFVIIGARLGGWAAKRISASQAQTMSVTLASAGAVLVLIKGLAGLF